MSALGAFVQSPGGAFTESALHARGGGVGGAVEIWGWSAGIGLLYVLNHTENTRSFGFNGTGFETKFFDHHLRTVVGSYSGTRIGGVSRHDGFGQWITESAFGSDEGQRFFLSPAGDLYATHYQWYKFDAATDSWDFTDPIVFADDGAIWDGKLYVAQPDTPDFGTEDHRVLLRTTDTSLSTPMAAAWPQWHLSSRPNTEWYEHIQTHFDALFGLDAGLLCLGSAPGFELDPTEPSGDGIYLYDGTVPIGGLSLIRDDVIAGELAWQLEQPHGYGASSNFGDLRAAHHGDHVYVGGTVWDGTTRTRGLFKTDGITLDQILITGTTERDVITSIAAAGENLLLVGRFESLTTDPGGDDELTTVVNGVALFNPGTNAVVRLAPGLALADLNRAQAFYHRTTQPLPVISGQPSTPTKNDAEIIDGRVAYTKQLAGDVTHWKLIAVSGESNPPGASIDGAGLVSWAPVQNGSTPAFARTFSVYGSNGEWFDEQQWYVFPQFEAPIIEDIDDEDFEINSGSFMGQYSKTPTLTLGDQPDTWTLLQAPPDTLFNASSGQCRLLGADQVAGPATFEVRCENLIGADTELWVVTFTDPTP